MEVGSLFSATFYFRKESSLCSAQELLVYLLVVTVVTGVEGVPLPDQRPAVEGRLQPWSPDDAPRLFSHSDGITFRYSRRRPKTGTLEEMSLKQYVLVGLGQGFAALPGVSSPG